MKTALITGVAGQDGSYLAEYLLGKDYRVIGIDSNRDKFSVSGLADRVELADWDMLDQARITEILKHYRPQEVYNYAACSSGEGMFLDPVIIGEINGLAVARLLQAIYEVDRDIRFCQASSSEMFGETIESPQSESTPFYPRSPYGAAKLYAHAMIQIYRKTYGLFLCSAILFNHESPRRGLGFVTRKVAYEVARIKLGLAGELKLGNLNARRDWGFAGDYVYAMWLMLQHLSADDYVIATGETHSVKELCETAFGYLGLDYRDYVCEDKTVFRPSEPVPLVGNAKKARAQLGWRPKVEFKELIEMMVDHDLEKLKEQSGLQKERQGHAL